MSECQEGSEARFGKTAELLDAGVGHFAPVRERRAGTHSTGRAPGTAATDLGPSRIRQDPQDLRGRPGVTGSIYKKDLSNLDDIRI